jgi:calcium channel MID1
MNVTFFLYIFTVVLVLPLISLTGASELIRYQEDLLFGSNSAFPAYDLGRSCDMESLTSNQARLEKRATGKGSVPGSEEQNGVVKSVNLEWGKSHLHHWSTRVLFDTEPPGGVQNLDNNQGSGSNQLENGQRIVRLTFNTCIQPRRNTTAKESPGIPPPLQIFVSNSTSNRSPGPQVNGQPQFEVEVTQGFGEFDFTTSSDLWVAIYAPALPESQKLLWAADPPWNYELAVTTGEPYHGYRENQFLYLVDTDDTTALLVTGNMTATASNDGGVDEKGSTEVIMQTTPYILLAQNRKYPSKYQGLERSYCAVRLQAGIHSDNADVSMTTRGLGNLPKQQFHLRNLKKSSSYLAYLARPRTNKSTDTSGVLWRPLGLNTKKDGNCRIIYNLPFCSQVAYAVPSNPTVFGNDPTNLTKFYDNEALTWWKNFDYSLQQIQCNASSKAMFSLVRNCDDCATAYKNWLCAVTIPRCMDYTSPLPYLAERSFSKLFWNETAKAFQKHPFTPPLTAAEVTKFKESVNGSMANVPSRNSKIDEIVQPGAYKEVKPCKDLCWALVQSCPSALGFQCPLDGSWGKEMGYGERDPKGDITCSYLGAVYFLNSAMTTAAHGGLWVWMTVFGVVLWGL